MSAHELIARLSTLLYTVNQSANIHTTTLLESNYTSTSVKVSAPYITASNTETTRTIMVSSRYLFPRGAIHFKPPGIKGEIELSPNFVVAIDDALGKLTPTAQREALDVIVQIGGVLSAHTMETFNRRVLPDLSVKKDITGAGVTNGHGELQTTITTSEGRHLDILDTNVWIASTDDSSFWRVIEVNEVVPVVDLLPEPQKTAVKRLLLPPLGSWVPVEQTPYMDNFLVKMYRLQNAPTLHRKSGRNYVIATGRNVPGPSNQPFATLPRYSFLSTYFIGLSLTFPLGAALAALRPGLVLEGDWKLSPKQHEGDEDECWKLQSCVQIKLPGSATDDPPRPREAIRKNVIIFDSGDEREPLRWQQLYDSVRSQWLHVYVQDLCMGLQ
ncbi:hypothetical protein BC628DRAFT_1410894 [Trametes gibbosa]|nr:hypothetical protein BC628DRAFT_1410894 [Trametes gibbosa]